MARLEGKDVATLSNKNLLWVCGIVLVLAVLGMYGAKSSGMTASRRDLTNCCSNLKNLGVACEQYESDTMGRFPGGSNFPARDPQALQALVPKYLRQIPTCPSASSDTYTRGYDVFAGPDQYTIVCVGNWHVSSGLPLNFPQYSSTWGLRRDESAPWR